MELSEVGAEFDSCWRSARAILIGILQNRQEMKFSRKDRLAAGSYCAEVEGWGRVLGDVGVNYMILFFKTESCSALLAS